MSVEVIHGDMREVLGRMVAEGKLVQSIVTDPPYHLTMAKRLGNSNTTDVEKNFTKTNEGQGVNPFRSQARGFMGKTWDGGDIAFQPGTWRLCWELLPPGGHVLAFAGTRTYHRMAVAIEEAGFEIRDTIAWLYGSGFPKSLNVSKAIDKAAGAERTVRTGVKPGHENFVGRDNHPLNGGWDRPWASDPEAVDRYHSTFAPATDAARQWDGWGTALKPAMELICVARKPLDGTVAATVLKHGTGALNIDGCRVATDGPSPSAAYRAKGKAPSTCKPGEYGDGHAIQNRITPERWLEERPGEALGRWPANVCHDGSDEVVSAFPESEGGGAIRVSESDKRSIFGAGLHDRPKEAMGDSGSAARFFYSAKGDNGRAGEASANRRYTDKGATNFAALPGQRRIDEGSAARFFYSSKADADDRLGSKHPTVKPVDLMRWLVRLVTPPGGTCLDPFAGSGTTGMACMAEGIDCILVEREAEYVADIKARIAHVHGDDTPLFAAAPVVPPQGELL